MAEQQIIELLVSNGVGGQNSKAALQQLNSLKQDGQFVATVCGLVKATAWPVDPSGLSPQAAQCDWALIRDVAAWLLKTCILPGMAFDAMAAAADASLSVLRESGVTRRLVSAAAVVIARLTDLNGVDWWAANGLDLSNLLLSEMLPSPDVERATSALRCLQYLVEDAANSIGSSIAVIVERVADTAQNRDDARLRSMAIGVLASMYEFGAELDWKVENLSDVQQALCNGAGYAALAAASGLSAGIGTYDEDTTCKLFRLVELLLDYLANIAGLPISGDAIDHIFGTWASAAVAGVAPSIPAEVASFACGVVGSIFTNFDTSGGVGPIEQLASMLSQSMESLVDSMLHNILMKPEEEEDMMANDGYDVRDPHKRRKPVKRRGASKDDDDGQDDSGESAEASLRNYACIAIEAMSVYDPERVANRVINAVKNVFCGNENDWHRIECAICALGSIYNGAQQQLNQYLPNLVPLVGQAVGSGEPSPQHHIATISISLWALSKFSEWAMMHDVATYNAIAQCAMPCLTSSSKRVQFAAITFFRNTLTVCLAVDPQRGGPIAAFLPELVGKINICLPVYHTRNLKLLCTVTKFIIPLMGAQASSLIDLFSNQLNARLPRTQETMTQRYQHDDVRVQPDFDAFEIGRVTANIYAALDLTPEIAQRASSELTTFIEVIKFALQCEAQNDDTTPFFAPLENMALLLPSVDDQTLGGLVQQNGNELVRLMLHVAGNVEDPDVKSAACNLLYELLTRFGPNVLPNGPDEVVAVIATFGTVADSCSLVADSALLLLKLFEVMPPAATDAAQRFATVLAQQVRGDALDNDAMSLLAQCVGAMMQAIPQRFSVRAAGETAMALRRCENDQYKSDATFGVIAVLSAHAMDPSAASALSEALVSFVRLVLSWQRDASGFEGLVQGIGDFFAHVKQHPQLSQTLQGAVSERYLPTAAIQMMRSTYGL